MRHLKWATFALLNLAIGVGCSVTATGVPNGGAGAGGASTVQVGRCHDGCDKMKFFMCSSADQLSACYSDCGSAAPSQIEVFTACAENSICDPACRTNIVPKPASGGTPATGTGGSASSCSTACDKGVSCSFIPVGAKDACVADCQKSAYQYQIDCVNNNVCSDIKARCGGGTGSGGMTGGGTTIGGSGGTTGFDGSAPDQEVTICQFQCDGLLSRMCISADQQSSCRSQCTTAVKSVRETFSSCAQSSSNCDTALSCYQVFAK